MMHPEKCSSEKNNLEFYQVGHDGFSSDYEDKDYTKRLCCFQTHSQFCSKCGSYHKSGPSKYCLFLTFSTVIACVFLVTLTASVTLQIKDPQCTYKVVCHFLSVIAHNRVIFSQEEKNISHTLVNGTDNLNWATDFTDKTIITDDSKSEFSTGVTIKDESSPKYAFEDIVNSYNRIKRDASFSYIEPATKSSLLDNNLDCISFLSQFSSNSLNNGFDDADIELSEMYKHCQNNTKQEESEVTANLKTETNKTVNNYSNSYNVTSAPEMKQIPAPSLTSQNVEMTDFPDFSEPIKAKYFNKRNTYFESIPNEENMQERSAGSKTFEHNTLNNVLSEKSSFVSHENPQLTKRTWPYPPTGPDGSNFAESVKTSQQLTVRNNQLYKPVCFQAPNSVSSNPTSYVCIPITSHQFEPYQGPFGYSEAFHQMCPDGNCNSKGSNIDPTLPTVVSPSGINSDSSVNPNQQPIMMPPSYSPNIQVPTAIASPNPYYFPTFNGAPIMSQFPYDFRQPTPLSPQFNPMWSQRGGMSGFQNPPPFNMYNPQLYGHSFQGPPGMGWASNFPRQFQQPYVQTAPPQSQIELQNPVFCMYVPVQSHQFPVVNGVVDTKNRRVVNDPDVLTPSFQYGNHSLQDSYKSAEPSCEPYEFACTNPAICIPQTAWCDGHVDCPDVSDEMLCSCKHRVDKRRLCDGFFDCPSGEDELGCFGCDIDSFSCLDWETGREESTCVPLSKRCDNKVDCRNQKDEMECALLSDTVVPQKAQFVAYTSGLLHRNWKGRWYPACTGPEVTDWAVQACQVEVGELTSHPFVEMVSTEYPGPFIIPNGGDKYMLSHMCQEQKVVTHVKCSTVMCGTKQVQSLQSSFDPSQLKKLQDFNKLMPFRTTEDSEEKTINDDSCETCNLQPKEKKLNEYLLAGKSEGYLTQFEPLDRDDFMGKADVHRWARESVKVVGGSESQPGSWPWLVAIYQDGIFHCGGVTINELWVMTAAHCVENFVAHYYEVQAGMLRRLSFSPQEQTRTVTHVILHSLYNRVQMHNDLALLRLKRRLRYNRWVRPICLPDDRMFQYAPSPGTMCTAVGWGATVEHGPDPDHMHEVNVPILPYCKHRVDQEGAQICAGYMRGGHDTCQGDSGGPLVCRLPGETDRWYVAGVVSHGEGCARPDEPGVYTRVFLFVDWIKSIINEPVDTFLTKQMPLLRCPGQQCSSDGRCIPQHKLCDSHVDCLNAEDETSFCRNDYLGRQYFFLNDNSTDLNEELDVSYKKTKIQDDDIQDTSSEPSIDYFNNGYNPNEFSFNAIENSTNQSNSTKYHVEDERKQQIENLDSTTNGYFNDNTNLNNELIYSNKNKSVENEVQESDLNIPPYLVNILFSTTITPLNESSQSGSKNLSKSEVEPSEPTISLPEDSLANNNKLNQSIDIYSFNHNPFKDYIKDEDKEFYKVFCKHFINHTENKTEIQSTSLNPTDLVNVPATTEESVKQPSDPVINARSRELAPSIRRDKAFMCKRFDQTLLKKRRCDGFVDCEDGSDEEDCSCRDRLRLVAPSLVCDGQINCPDQSDEKNCKAKCSKKEFFCPKSKECIQKSKHCDGKRDCPRGDDEENCYALVKGDKLLINKNQQPEYNDEGLLAVFSSGRWRPLCVSSAESLEMASTVCTSLGFRGYEYFQKESVRDIPFVRLKSQTEDHPECLGLKVKCFSWRDGHPWFAPLFVEGNLTASAALIDRNWLLTHTSVCQFLKLKNHYVEVSFGHNNATLGLKFGSMYKQTARIDSTIPIDETDFCLLHTETPLHYNKNTRPLLIPFDNPRAKDSFYAVYASDEGTKTLNLTISGKNCENGETCFLVSKEPNECYRVPRTFENGFIVRQTLYSSYLEAIFPSFKIFCDKSQEVCVEKLSLSVSSVSAVIKKQVVDIVPAPFCDGVRCGKCVSWAKVASGENDCFSLQDKILLSHSMREEACQRNSSLCSCKVNELSCNNGQCIDKSFFCDGLKQCSDGSDEPDSCRNSCFKYLQLTAPEKICDGIRNCFDKSDETSNLCHNSTCKLNNSYKCKRDKKCIPQEFVCDNEQDCPNGDDEENCVAIQQVHSKRSEGILARQYFGNWSPKCFHKSISTDFGEICHGMGFNKAIYNEIISPNSTVIAQDSFSSVKLNEQTIIHIRKGRKMLEVDRNKECKQYYITCS